MLSGIAKVGKFIYAHRAGIAMGVGVASGVCALVEGCRKSASKTPQILDEHSERVEAVKSEFPEKEEMTEEQKKEYSKKLMKAYGRTGADLLKNYALTIGLGATSIACSLYSYGCIKGQYVALSGAYTVLSDKFDNYRENIIETYGEDADWKAMNDIVEVEIDGKKQFVQKNRTTGDVEFNCRDIVFTWDKTWDNFQDFNPAGNIAKIRTTFTQAQEQLDRGSVTALTLEEIIDCFGSVRARSLTTPLEWQVVGYEEGEQIEYEIVYDESYSHRSFNHPAPPISVIFKNTKPVLSKLKPNDDLALMMEDTYNGYWYNKKAEEELEELDKEGVSNE